jgi:hypothetical protein
MNTIYFKTEKSQRKVKAFEQGQLDKAMEYGWNLAYKKLNTEFFIITENNKCLRFNKQIIL